jgi:hypothetical protein
MPKINLGNTTIKGSPAHRYSEQKSNVLKRGLRFDISLEDWFEVWEKSGKWEQRGNKKHEYCMCRFQDKGHYTKGNVFIATNTENCKEGLANLPMKERHEHNKLPPLDKVNGFYFSKTLKTKKYVAQLRNKHIGSFDTPEEARQAYLLARFHEMEVEANSINKSRKQVINRFGEKASVVEYSLGNKNA